MPPKKIVILVPAHESKIYSIKDCLHSIHDQTYPHNLIDVLVLVNNSSDNFYKALHALAKTIDKDSPDPKQEDIFHVLDIGIIGGNYKGDIFGNVVNTGIASALPMFNPDYYLVVGADVSIPDVTVAELLSPFHLFKDAGIACLTCYYREIDNILDKLRVMTEGGDAKIPMAKVPKDQYPITHDKYYKEKWFKAIAGNGAMMFPKDIALEIPWRGRSYETTGIGSDFQFCLDVHEIRKLWCYINTRIYTPHLDIVDGKITY